MSSDLVRNFKNLKLSLKNFESGEKDVYTMIAVILRTLLAEKTPLILKAFPYLKFAPLKETAYKINEHTCLYVSHELFSKDIFDLDDNKELELKDWLCQNILNEEITIGELIKSVADKEAAHSDDYYNETLIITNNVCISKDVALHADFIWIVGKYIFNILEQEINIDKIKC